jgi:caffeoyl-CoA O-methyltransferase
VSLKSIGLSDELHTYLVAHNPPLDAIVTDLLAETQAAFPEFATLSIAPEQASFLTFLARLTGARHAVEIGTFTGLSSLSIVRGLAAGGRLTCFDISKEFTDLARRYWERAGVADRIDLRIGPAARTLAALPADPPIDLAFIDADKPGYRAYYEEIVPRLRSGGVVLLDNVLWSGNVVDGSVQDENTQAIRAVNDHIAADDRVEAVVLPIADGLTICRKR